MLNSNEIINSFNIFSKDIRNPNLVNEEEIRVASYIGNTKEFWHYNRDLGLENKIVIESVLNNIGVIDGIKVDKEITDIMLESYLNSELLNNNFTNFTINIRYAGDQTKVIEVTFNKNNSQQDIYL